MNDPMSGSAVKILSSGRIGVAVQKNGDSWKVVLRDRNFLFPDVFDLPEDDLKFLKVKEISGTKVKSLISGQIDLRALTEGSCILGDISPKSRYKLKAKDLLGGIKSILVAPDLDAIACYYHGLCSFYYDIMDFPEESDHFDENDILEYVCEFSSHILSNLLESPHTVDLSSLISLIEYNETVLEDFLNEGIIADEVYGKLLAKTDADEICKESEASMKKYKFALEQLCAKDDPEAIKTRGYCYYSGNKLYRQDFYKAREAFHKYYAMTGSAQAANTLGYIYYYGRCNNGVPQYDEAFKYFSIGYAGGYYESTFKLGDMFNRGLCVAQNDKIANELYWQVYNQNFDLFRYEKYDNNFADAALRMGNCYHYGIGCEEDLETAYAYYLQAEYAISKRIKENAHYGDTVVYSSVQKEMEKVRDRYKVHDSKAEFVRPSWALWLGIGPRKAMIRIAPFPDGSLLLEATPLKCYKDKDEPPKILVVIPQADYCSLKSKLMVRTAPQSSYEIYGHSEKIIFNNVTYDVATGVTTFLLDDMPMGRIKTDKYTVSAPTPPGTKAKKGKKYRFVAVKFEHSRRTYDYLCDDKTVQIGDYVLVDGYQGETRALVVNVFERYESQLSLPLTKYKNAYKDKRGDNL